jgi:ABC-type bacteriocin/lantibiotic exporter with double-glycine peptidase domain
VDDGLLQRQWFVPTLVPFARVLFQAWSDWSTLANALGIFSPAITLVLFTLLSAQRGHKLDVETAFTTMAILSMVTHPANMVMTIVPRAVAAFAGFERIQAFLLRPSLRDERGSLPRPPEQPERSADSAIRVLGIALVEGQPILKDVALEVNHGSLAIISGPVGSGKSTLLRAILGEIRPTHGSIQLVSKQVAYCAQNPWLPNGTIKQAICGMDGEGDAFWYQQVIDACCLNHDLELLPNGDGTQIGSGGLALSGGQRQRVVSTTPPN